MWVVPVVQFAHDAVSAAVIPAVLQYLALWQCCPVGPLHLKQNINSLYYHYYCYMIELIEMQCGMF